MFVFVVFYILRVFIFCSVWFLSKKIIKTGFLKKNRNRFKSTGFGSVILKKKSVQTGLTRFFRLGFFLFQAYKIKTEPNRLFFQNYNQFFFLQFDFLINFF
jgi:hypothetical protein